MNNIFTIAWLKSAGMRVLHTMAQVMVGMITVGAATNEVDWVKILSVALVAGVVSLLKSVVAGTPESSTDGTVTVSDNEDKTAYEFTFKDISPEKIKTGEVLMLDVINNLESK